MGELKSSCANLCPPKASSHGKESLTLSSVSLADDGPALPSQRIFTPPGDGRSYKWTLGLHHLTVRVNNVSIGLTFLITEILLKLELNDSSKTTVARSHRSNSGVIGKPRQARLEVYPGFEHFIDILLITYIYVEKLRKNREDSRSKKRVSRKLIEL